MTTKIGCIKRSDLERLIEEAKKLEGDDKVCVYYDVEEPKIILGVFPPSCYGFEPAMKTIEIRYPDYDKLLETLTEIIRIYNIEEIRSNIRRYENRIEKIKEKIENAKKHNDQLTLKSITKYEKMIEGLKLKIKGLQEQIQKINPQLVLGTVAEDVGDLERFLDIIDAPRDVNQLLEYYVFGKFIDDEAKLPLNICDDVEPADEEEVDITDPYWCVKDEFDIEGYLVFLPAEKSLKVVLSITSDEYKELERDVPLYTMKFNDAYNLLKTVDEYYNNYLIF